jgi:RecB family exonuclease
VKKIPRQISEGESFGLSIHNTLKKFGLLELKNVAPLDPKKQLMLFTEEVNHSPVALDQTTLLTLWRECFIAEGYPSRTEMDAKLAQGERALIRFFEWWNASQRTVLAVEESFKLTIEKSVIAGRFDRVERSEKGLTIIDFKSGGPRKQEEVDADLQLSVYAMAATEKWGEPVDTLMLLSVTEDGCMEQRTTRSQSQLKDARTQIRLLAERIESKDFTATPSINVCRYCPYRNICPVRAG